MKIGFKAGMVLAAVAVVFFVGFVAGGSFATGAAETTSQCAQGPS